MPANERLAGRIGLTDILSKRTPASGGETPHGASAGSHPDRRLPPPRAVDARDRLAGSVAPSELCSPAILRALPQVRSGMSGAFSAIWSRRVRTASMAASTASMLLGGTAWYLLDLPADRAVRRSGRTVLVRAFTEAEEGLQRRQDAGCDGDQADGEPERHRRRVLLQRREQCGAGDGAQCDAGDAQQPRQPAVVRS